MRIEYRQHVQTSDGRATKPLLHAGDLIAGDRPKMPNSIVKLGNRDQSPRMCRASLASFFRGLYPSNTANSVSDDTRIPPGTVDKWLREASAPSSDHLATLLAVYGAPLMAAAYPVARPWLEQRVQKHDLQDAARQLHDVLAGFLERQR